ncbi:uncharacterized protein BDV14DRAFT_144709 [Aspergillus stella-maris]|uniref:uncharacterized protein n=1 Tax=Aspergillus stella-maris TaxID=1810926 RepID=UPI003CCD8169
MHRIIITLLVAYFALMASAAPKAPDLENEDLGLVFTEVKDKFGNEDVAITWDEERRSELAREAADAESPEDDDGEEIDPSLDADLDALTSDKEFDWDEMPSWEAEPTPGAAPIILNGTLEDVYAQLKEINPNYDTDFKDIIAHEQAAEEDVYRSNNHKVNCWEKGKIGATIPGVNYGIQVLRRLARTKPKPRPGQRPGPDLEKMRCMPAICHRGDAIWWCNLDDKPKTLPSWNNVADGGEVLKEHCTKRGRVAGVHQHNDKWTVAVRGYMEKCGHMIRP